VEANVGAYGYKTGEHWGLGLDFRGDLREYDNYSQYDGGDAALVLSYRYQFSKRLIINLNETGGTYSNGNTSVAQLVNSTTGSTAAGPTLFDTRLYYLRSGVDATYIASSRMSYQASAQGFYQAYGGSGGASSYGYTANGVVTRRLTKNVNIGGSYSFNHFEFPSSQSSSNSQSFQGNFAMVFANYWTLSVGAGATYSEIKSPIVIPLSPVYAALFGVPSITAILDDKTWYPSGSGLLKRRFRHSEASAGYSRGITSGGTTFYTSRTENAGIGWSYSGIRRWSFSLNGNYWNNVSLGGAPQKYTVLSAGGGFTYSVARYTYIIGNYNYRVQDYDAFGAHRDGARITVGVNFSPGNVPLNWW
jgi:hypothetical protein